MTLDKLKQIVLKLPPEELHDLIVWTNTLFGNYGDVPGDCFAKLPAEI